MDTNEIITVGSIRDTVGMTEGDTTTITAEGDTTIIMTGEEGGMEIANHTTITIDIIRLVTHMGRIMGSRIIIGHTREGFPGEKSYWDAN